MHDRASIHLKSVEALRFKTKSRRRGKSRKRRRKRRPRRNK